MTSKRTRLLALVCLAALLLTACGGRKTTGQAAPGDPAPAQTDTQLPADGDENQTPEEPVPATPEPVPTVPPEDYEPWGPGQVVEHIFFHPVIAYPQWGFHDCPSNQSQKLGLDDWMVTVDEYNKILQSIYDNGYIIVSINDVWSEYTDDNGNVRMQRNTLMLPPSKKPLIISYDDVNYYDYMLEQGFTSKLVIGDDGDIWAECTDPYTHETFLTQDLDAVTILDKFIRQHPDFSLNGAKGCLGLTGFQGILGYRTQTDRSMDAAEAAAWEPLRQKERQAVAPIVKRLKETGWYFASHTYSHIRLGTRTMETIQDDTQRWLDEVGSLVGETSILLYPYGSRPDGDNDVTQTGPQFLYLQSKGFRVFCSVGVESYSKVKSDTAAVICDRLHPDGTTLRRGGRTYEYYSRFYDAKKVIGLDVRPDLGVTW